MKRARMSRLLGSLIVGALAFAGAAGTAKASPPGVTYTASSCFTWFGTFFCYLNRPPTPTCNRTLDWTANAELNDPTPTNCHIQIGGGALPLYNFPALIKDGSSHHNCEPQVIFDPNTGSYISLLALFANAIPQQYLVCNSPSLPPANLTVTYRDQTNDCRAGGPH